MGFILDLKNEITNDPGVFNYVGVALPLPEASIILDSLYKGKVLDTAEKVALAQADNISDKVHKSSVQQLINEAIAGILNTKNIYKPVESLTRTQILSAITAASLDLATADNIAKVNLVMSDNVDPFNATVVKVFQDAFDAATITALNALRNGTQTRAQELGFIEIKAGHIAMARLR